MTDRFNYKEKSQELNEFVKWSETERMKMITPVLGKIINLVYQMTIATIYCKWIIEWMYELIESMPVSLPKKEILLIENN